MSWLVVFFLIVVLSFLYGVLRKHPQLPGPFSLPIIGGAYVFAKHLSSSRILYKWMELTEKYKGTFAVRMGPELQIIISKPEHVQIYCTTHSLLDHADFYSLFKPVLGEGLFLANGAAWKTKRKAWAASFHPSVLRHFFPIYSEYAEILVEVLAKEVGGPEFSIFPYLRDCFLDLILKNHLEYNYNSQTEPKPLNQLFEPVNEILYRRVFALHLQNDKIFSWTSSGQECARVVDGIHKLVNDVVETKRRDYQKEGALPADESRNNIFIRKLLNTRQCSEQELFDEIVTIGVTGYETLSRVMGFVLLMLGKHQDIQDRVVQEDQLIQQQLAGKGMEINDLQNYEYVERVIKETLRLFPVGPLLGRKASEDLKIGEITIAKGTTIMCNVVSLHRNPEIYPNPLRFNPDNFLPERVEERHPYSFLPFSSGPRSCIGTRYAMEVLKAMIPVFLRRYRVISKKDVEDIGLKVEVTMADNDGFILRLEKR